MSGPRRAEEFDPYSYALQWYMDHPKVLCNFELEIKRAREAGITLDELEEIEAKAFEIGKLVRVSQESGPVREHPAWLEYENSLPRGTKTTAREAYYRGYKNDHSHREEYQGSGPDDRYSACSG